MNFPFVHDSFAYIQSNSFTLPRRSFYQILLFIRLTIWLKLNDLNSFSMDRSGGRNIFSSFIFIYRWRQLGEVSWENLTLWVKTVRFNALQSLTLLIAFEENNKRQKNKRKEILPFAIEQCSSSCRRKERKTENFIVATSSKIFHPIKDLTILIEIFQGNFSLLRSYRKKVFFFLQKNKNKK